MKKTLTPAAVVLLAAVAATPLAAQQIKVGAKVGEAPVTSGSYESLGHRDPFISLVARRTANPSAPRTGSGLLSMQVAEVVITGITRFGPDKFMAFLQSPDRQSYVAKVKDRIADAVIKSIDAQSVVFVEINEPGVSSRPREVRKFLRPISEVNR